MAKKQRLLQILMKSGRFDKIYSAKQAIFAGKIKVDDKMTTNPDFTFNPRTHKVFFEGKELKTELVLRYFILNKPQGYSCQKGEQAKKTVYEFIQKLPGLDEQEKRSLHPVGRLDEDTEGLLIITNDGKLSSKILRPEKEIQKTYYAIVHGFLEDKSIWKLKSGVRVDIGDKMRDEFYVTKPAKIKLLKRSREKSFLELRITEGKKRQVRKMLAAVGNKVLFLKRIAIGKLELGELKLGEMREVTKEFLEKKLS
ncbi:MAG: pseudouridine synthase [Nanoarchaeota archaeon]